MYPASSLQLIIASETSNYRESTSRHVSIKIFVHNDTRTPVTILTWNTPLDSQAGILDIFKISNVTDGQNIVRDTIKMSRRLPATYEDLVEIAAGQSVNRTVMFPTFEFQDGVEYSIQAQGVWHAIWEKPLAEVTESQLAELTSATRGEFRSNIFRLRAN